jgi:hypothetical protein
VRKGNIAIFFKNRETFKVEQSMPVGPVAAQVRERAVIWLDVRERISVREREKEHNYTTILPTPMLGLIYRWFGLRKEVFTGSYDGLN